MNRALSAVVGLLVLSACAIDEPLGVREAPDTDLDAHFAPVRAPNAIRAMTYNLYVGTDVDIILGAQDPTQIPLLVAQAFANLQATNFPERAEAIADIIGRSQPHIVGLQEVSKVLIQSPGDFLIGNPQMAKDVVIDFLDVLRAALKARNLDYRAVAMVGNADVELPSATGDDIRLQDFDVILARGDVATANSAVGRFAVNLIVPSPGLGLPDIPVWRGWTAVDARVGKTTIRFVNTHLEPFLDLVQIAQAAELLAIFAGETRPVVMVGDFNSSADGTGTPTYGNVLAAGYLDAWNLTYATIPGYTSGQEADLRNGESLLSKRIDFIFVRDGVGTTVARTARTIVVGDEQRDRTVSGLWPSDHAGVVSTLRFGYKRVKVADGR
jgi:endonuclease/exonuclease/phosphatase family metal-dependent hydrolase